MLWLVGKDVDESIALVDALNIQGPRRIAYREVGSMIRFRPHLVPADVLLHYSCMLFTEDEVLNIRAQRVTLVSLPCTHHEHCEHPADAHVS